MDCSEPITYVNNAWTPVYINNSDKLNALVLYLAITNNSETVPEIDCEIIVTNQSDVLVHVVLPKTGVTKANPIDTSSKVILKPGWKIKMKAAEQGLIPYTSVCKGV